MGAPPGEKGRTVTLDIKMDRARIEDVMRMAIKADPPLRGALRLTTKFVLPPGESDVADRLRLDGEFAVARVRFMNYDVQGKINELSRRGRGRADQPRDRVVSDLAGALPPWRWAPALPARDLQRAGGAGATGRALRAPAGMARLPGRLLLDAKVSQTQTGIKSTSVEAVRSALQPARRRQHDSDSHPRTPRRSRVRHRYGPRVQTRRQVLSHARAV